MKLSLLIAAIGCTLVAPGLAYPRTQAPRPRSTACASCAIPRNAAEEADVASQFSGILPQRIKTKLSTWRRIQRASGTQSGPYIMINNTLANVDELCGARWLVRGDCGLLHCNYQEAFEYCKYLFSQCLPSDCMTDHDQMANAGNANDEDDEIDEIDENEDLEDDDEDLEEGEGDEAQDKDDPDVVESNSMPTPFQGGLCINGGKWMRNCREVTLCKHISCEGGCWAPLNMGFEDWSGPFSTPTCPTVFMGFLFSGTWAHRIQNPIISPIPGTDATASEFKHGVISRKVALVVKPFDDPFKVSRFCRDFKVNFVFITWVHRENETKERLKINLYGKKRNSPWSDHSCKWLRFKQPYCFAPCRKFTDLKQFKIRAVQPDGQDILVIDNLSLCG